MRFLSPDQLSPFGWGGLNAYAYCAGDPVNHSDPSGKAVLDWLVQGIFAVGNVATVGAGISFNASRHANPPIGQLSRLQRFTDRAIGSAFAAGGALGLVARGATVNGLVEPARSGMFNQVATYANVASGTLVVSATVIYEGRAAYRWWQQAAVAGRQPGRALLRGVYETAGVDLFVGAVSSLVRAAGAVGRALAGAVNSVANWREESVTIRRGEARTTVETRL
jgi:hypothetical protein